MHDDPLILIHGAQRGGWAWGRTIRPLRELGFDVHAVTLTGLGDRAHLLTADVDLNTHITDVVALIEAEELTGVTLVGHSYGGMVAAGVTARLRHPAIKRIVYLDSPVPVDGECSITVHQHGHLFRERRTVINGIPMLPLSDGSGSGLAGDDLAWVRRHLTPQPYGAVSTPLHLPPGWDDGVDHVYIRCVTGPDDPPRPYLSRVDVAAGWRYRELFTGHDCMITAPGDLVEMLGQLCGADAGVGG